MRAAVDDPRAAIGLGINVPQVFAFTFAFGCGLAGLGGALSAEILGLDPYLLNSRSFGFEVINETLVLLKVFCAE